MSTEIAVIKNTGRDNSSLRIVSYSGPKEKGQMVQLSQGFDLMHLTKKNAEELIAVLFEWGRTRE